MSQIKGLDISRHQGAVDWNKIEAAIKSGEIGFVSVRAGYGGGGIDDQFARNWRELRARNIPRNAYFFAYPGRSFGVQQAQEFYNIVGPLQNGESVMLDMEGDTTYGRDLVSSDVQWAFDFLNKARDLFGVKPFIYMNSYDKGRFDWSRVVNGDYGLWLANYGPNNGQPNGAGPDPAPWKFWAIWQFTSRGNVAGISPVDVNIFNGDVAAFLKYGKQGGAAPTPQPTPTPTPKPQPSGNKYTVQKGDSLSGIAAKFGTTWQKIYADNKAVIGPDPNLIKPGQVLTIGGSGGSAPAPSGRKYTVQKGDSLSSIAGKYGTTWQSLYAKNKAVIGPDPNLIKPGQVLAID